LTKKNCIFILFISVVAIFDAFGQGGFVKRHYIQNVVTAYGKDVIETPEGNLIATGIVTDSALGSHKLSLLGMNSSGTVLWKKIYGHSNLFFYYNDMHPRGPFIYDASGFYQAFCATDSFFGRTFGVLIKFDYNGDTLWQKKYTSTDTLEDVLPQGMCFSADGGILITGLFEHWGAGGRQCLVLKTDINGNELWRNRINKPAPNVQDGKSIVQDKFTKKIIIVGYQLIPPYDPSAGWGACSNILILDSLGNQPLRKTFNNYNGGGFGEVIQLRDSNFLACGAVNMNNDLGNLKRKKSRVVKFNSSGVIIWQHDFDTLSFFNSIYLLRELDNGDILTLGYLDTLINYNVNEVINIKVARMDKNGNRLWHRNIGEGINGFPLSLNPTKDGGFILAARDIIAGPPQPYYIIKIDSNGCDTLEAYCRYIDALSISAFSKLNGYRFQIFPNPAREKLNVNIEAAHGKSFSIRILDINGREMESLHIKPSTNVEINTSGYAPGVYLLTVMYEDKAVETKKLVVLR